MTVKKSRSPQPTPGRPVQPLRPGLSYPYSYQVKKPPYYLRPMTLSKYSSVFVLLLIAGPCLAGPDFSSSTIAPRNPSPLTSDIVVFDLVLRNTGNEGGTPVFLDVDWGAAGFLANTEGLDSAEVDHDAGTLRHYLALPAGAEKRVSLHLFTFSEAKGDALSVRMRLADFNHS